MERFVFGSYVLEPRARLVTRQGGSVHLTPKAFQLLELLVRSRPAPLSKADLMTRVWPGTFVSEHSLANLVSEIRKALDGDGVPYIRTVHGFGYAFCGEVSVAPAAPSIRSPPYILAQAGPHACSFGVGDGVTVIGRAVGSDVCLLSPTVSRRHAQICVEDGVAILEDLGSLHGTFVAGRRISGPVRLADGDKVQFGAIPLTFRTEARLEEDTDDS